MCQDTTTILRDDSDQMLDVTVDSLLVLMNTPSTNGQIIHKLARICGDRSLERGKEDTLSRKKGRMVSLPLHALVYKYITGVGYVLTV